MFIAALVECCLFCAASATLFCASQGSFCWVNYITGTQKARKNEMACSPSRSRLDHENGESSENNERLSRFSFY
jgi:hypothetical protein